MTQVYLVHCFTGDYLDMYHAVHQIKYVLTEEAEAIRIVEADNARLKKRQDYHKEQNAWYERVTIGECLFD